MAPPSVAERTKPFEYRQWPGLQGLRGVAVLLVVAFHAAFGQMALWESPARGGFLGVNIFFVMSGFLVTSILLSDRRLSLGALARFYGRRLARVTPALALLGVACLGLALWAQTPPEARRTLQNIPAALGYWSNFVEASADGPKPHLLAHTWSLAVEVQFYVLWAFVVLGLRRLGMRPWMLLAVTVALIQLVAGWRAIISADGGSFERLYFSFDTRADDLLTGAALALALMTFGVPQSERSRVVADMAGAASLVGLLAFATTVRLEDWWLYERGGFQIVALLAASVVFACVVDPEGLCAQVLSWRPLQAIGRISYSIYLWHWPVFFLTRPDRLGWSFGFAMAVRLVLTFALAAISYLVVERWTLARARRREDGTVSPAPHPEPRARPLAA